MLDKLVVLNYQSIRGIDNLPSSSFWFTSSLIRIIGNKSFSRGDIAKVVNIKKPSETEWNIFVDVLGDPNTFDEEALKAAEDHVGEIPTLILVTNKIYLDETSDLHVYGSENVEIALNCSSVMNGNKSYTIALLITGKQGTVHGVDKTNGTEVEWLITDSPRRGA